MSNLSQAPHFLYASRSIAKALGRHGLSYLHQLIRPLSSKSPSTATYSYYRMPCSILQSTTLRKSLHTSIPLSQPLQMPSAHQWVLAWTPSLFLYPSWAKPHTLPTPCNLHWNISSELKTAYQGL